MGKIRRSFTANKKLQVIKYAEKHGNRSAEKQFNVAESNIRFWRKNKTIIEAMPETLRSLRYSRARHPQLEEELKTIIIAEQQKHRDEQSKTTEMSNRIRTCDIRRLALSLARNKFGLTSQQFCARPTWVFSFCRRNGIEIGNKKQSRKFDDLILMKFNFLIFFFVQISKLKTKKHENYGLYIEKIVIIHIIN